MSDLLSVMLVIIITSGVIFCLHINFNSCIFSRLTEVFKSHVVLQTTRMFDGITEFYLFYKIVHAILNQPGSIMIS